jgi:hypothetical protein
VRGDEFGAGGQARGGGGRRRGAADVHGVGAAAGP